MLHTRSEGAPPLALAPLAALAAALAAGCGAYEGADVCLVRDPVRARARSPVPRPLWSEPEDEGPRNVTLSLRPRGPTGASLDIIGEAVRLVPGLGTARSAVDAIDHFSRADGPRFVIRLARVNGRGSETWLIDRAWALKKLDGGALLVWEGDLAPVVETLSLVIPRSE